MLDALGRIAPVTAVRGNNDRERWAAGIAETEVVEIGGTTLYVLNDVHELDLDPRRFKLPISVGRLTIEGGRVAGSLVTLEIQARP